jgi:enoyl-CoA hydratase
MLGVMLMNGPVAVRSALEAIQRGVEMGLDDALALEANIFGVVCATDDAREGLAAFLEKRKPVFQNH